jgi:hypothetical protein
MTPLMLLACAGTPSSLHAPTLSADRATQAALVPPAWTVCAGTGDFDTIQDAIDAASDGDTIEVCRATYNEDLVIEKPLTLVDDGGMTTIDGSGTTSVVSIETAGLVTIEGFVIQGGAATNGGGIYAMGMDLTLDLTDNLVQNNSATGMGGGVYIGRGVDGLFTDNVFQLNTADMGGGIASMMSDVTIQLNHIHRNNCTTTDTTAYVNGGGGAGVFVRGGANIIDNWIHADRSTLHGGGGFFYQATGEISLNRVHDNPAVGDGAGFYFTASAGAIVSGNEYYLNHAGGDGGAIHVYRGGVTITDSSFYDNDAAGNGGAIHLALGSSTIMNNTFDDNIAGGVGGAIDSDGDSSDISGCTFTGNSATRGGALHNAMGNQASMLTDLDFDSNSATECGGAWAVDDAPEGITLRGGTIRGNTAPIGAAFCMTRGTETSAVTMQNPLLIDNVASTSSGAFDVTYGVLNVDNATVVGSETGAVGVEDGIVSLDNTIFTDGSGAFADVRSGGSIVIRSSLFFGNVGGWGDITRPTRMSGSVFTDPLFVDEANGDYSLGAGSPAIDAGLRMVRDTDGSRSDIGKTGGPWGW